MNHGKQQIFGQMFIFYVELLGILDGLTLVRNKSFDGVMMQTDSLEVIKVIQNSFLFSSNNTLIRRIHHIIVKIGSWSIQYFSRDHNKIVDCLAKIAFDTN